MFPILIVIVLAFFAQRLISPPSQRRRRPTFKDFRAQIENRPTEIDSVTFQQKTETLNVIETDGDEYSTGYPQDLEATLVNKLDPQAHRHKVEGTGGSSFLSSSPTSSRSSSSSASGSS